MLQPRPALAHTVQDHLSPGAVGDVGRRQKTAVGVDRDVALATHDLLARVGLVFFSILATFGSASLGSTSLV
jgi:hypothetical protein